ncbi:MAG TPA: response regulator [Clostridia bacterium]|nr:response regulator [Clostridia bacterium]
MPVIETAGKKEPNKDFKNEIPRSLRILLIEDNHDLAEMLRTMLQLKGHTVDTAYNGVEGIEKIKKFLPDVVFCDIGMSEMDGIETAKRIRNEPSLKDLFLVALTGYAAQRDIELAIESGFNRHLAKPVDGVTLEKILVDVP